MKFATIATLDSTGQLAKQIQNKLDRKTKPPGSLGRLEALAMQLCLIQDNLQPRIDHAHVLVFVADHGVVAQGVSPYPQAVTGQMVANFCNDGAAISVLAKTFGAQLKVIDAGILTAMSSQPRLQSLRIGPGTADFSVQPAMTLVQAQQAVQAGIELVTALPPRSVLMLGEMGIGNTTCAAALAHALTDWPATDCVGRGTGVDDAGLARKTEVIRTAVARLAGDRDPWRVLCEVGGFEVAMLAGAILAAAANRQVIVIDGFISTAAAALAFAWMPQSRDYCVFSHVSAEAAHRRWLAALGVKALLDLDMRLGEASGAVLALPLLRAACAIINEMATFESAGVDDRSA